ncbi:hypothetical protein [Neisseria sp. P0017.S007]|uniref:hypothetical protein n=2 Tax=Neisseria TaxID=482 RepID=UPI00205712A4|nr:MAG TPA: hypothetical protein [Caudoviricetes sp.]DAS68595.1 MAG TPA: hypothetical protein [Caudoviricetes sp.]
MKNWLIEKLGGVSKKDHEEVIQTANSLKNMADDYSQRISDGLKEKAEMEEAGKEMSERISELIDKLNEERKVSNGLMAKGTALGIKVSEIQDELERKDKELSETKVQLLDVLRNKPDSALRSEIARLKGELELLKRNKFKRGRK